MSRYLHLHWTPTKTDFNQANLSLAVHSREALPGHNSPLVGIQLQDWSHKQ